MKLIKIRIGIYIAAFLLTAIFTYMFALKTTVSTTDTTSMKDATLPLVYMTTESGIKYNSLHGYTGDVNPTEIRDVITPIEADRNLQVSMNLYQSDIQGISYEIRTMDAETLVERTEVKDYTEKNQILTADFQFKNLLEEDTEYLLKIIVDTEDNGGVAYYTRIMILDQADVDGKLQYVMNLSKDTFSEDTLSNLTSKIEPDSTGDNTTLGRVTIHSKLAQFGFGGLNPEIISDVWPTLNEIDGSRASITLNYTAATTEDEQEQQYAVKEYFRINQVDSTVTYVYNYDRWMDQVFDPDNAITVDGDIYLGITSGDPVQMMADENGNFTAFVRNQTLWCYNAEKNAIVKVFSFHQEDSDGLREDNDEHAIKILGVDTSGNIRYVVYGYMNRGVHEGALGVSVCEYDSANKTSTELAFIPRTEPYKVIEQDIDTLIYINEKNILYFYENGSIYYLDYKTKEYMIVADDVVKDSCKMSDLGSVFIYQKGENSYSCDQVQVLHLDTGVIYPIQAEEGDYIQALGFIDGNIVYGQAHQNMIEVNEDGNVNFPMYKITLIDENHKVVREYNKEGIYVTSAEFDGAKILFNRAKLDESNNLVAIDSDEMLSNLEDSTDELSIYEGTTEARQKELYIEPLVTGLSQTVSVSEADYVFPSDASVYIGSDDTDDQTYFYSYGYGSLNEVSTQLSDVIAAASGSGGVVVDTMGQVIWTRYKETSAMLDIPAAYWKAAGNSQVAATDLLVDLEGITGTSTEYYDQGYTTIDCLEKLAGSVVNLTGCPVENVLFFIGNGHPVLAKTGSNTYEVIYGYDSSTITTIDFTTGQSKNYSYTDFNNTIANYGDVLMTIGE